MLRILAQNMPLIVITGIPCSGKSTVTKAIKEHLETQSKKVRIHPQFTEIVSRQTRSLLFLESDQIGFSGLLM